jgi:hypothetical protein
VAAVVIAGVADGMAGGNCAAEEPWWVTTLVIAAVAVTTVASPAMKPGTPVKNLLSREQLVPPDS